MNKLINTFIQKFFDTDKEPTAEQVSTKYARDAATYESSLITAISHNYLNKTYHIVNTFIECAKDIIKNVDTFSDTSKFSGWTFDKKIIDVKRKAQNMHRAIFLYTLKSYMIMNTQI